MLSPRSCPKFCGKPGDTWAPIVRTSFAPDPDVLRPIWRGMSAPGSGIFGQTKYAKEDRVDFNQSNGIGSA